MGAHWVEVVAQFVCGGGIPPPSAAAFRPPSDLRVNPACGCVHERPVLGHRSRRRRDTRSYLCEPRAVWITVASEWSEQCAGCAACVSLPTASQSASQPRPIRCIPDTASLRYCVRKCTGTAATLLYSSACVGMGNRRPTLVLGLAARPSARLPPRPTQTLCRSTRWSASTLPLSALLCGHHANTRTRIIPPGGAGPRSPHRLLPPLLPSLSPVPHLCADEPSQVQQQL